MARPPLSPVVALLLAAACAPAVPPGTADAPSPAPGTPAGPARPARPAPPPAATQDLVEQMRERWGDAWAGTLELRQRNTTYTSAGEASSEWLRRQRVPGRLRIDFVTPQPNGSGLLYRGDSTYVVDAGEVVRAAAQPNALQRLAADAHVRPADSTLALLARLDVDTARFRRDRWQGRDAWVVGADAGDSTSTQLWVDAERLLVVRLLLAQRLASGRTLVTDHHLSYQDVDGRPVPAETVYLRGGRAYLRERYEDVRTGVVLDEALFVPAEWARGVPTP